MRSSKRNAVAGSRPGFAKNAPSFKIARNGTPLASQVGSDHIPNGYKSTYNYIISTTYFCIKNPIVNYYTSFSFKKKDTDRLLLCPSITLGDNYSGQLPISHLLEISGNEFGTNNNNAIVKYNTFFKQMYSKTTDIKTKSSL